jgi:hypothetical protein
MRFQSHLLRPYECGNVNLMLAADVGPSGRRFAVDSSPAIAALLDATNLDKSFTNTSEHPSVIDIPISKEDEEAEKQDLSLQLPGEGSSLPSLKLSHTMSRVLFDPANPDNEDEEDNVRKSDMNLLNIAPVGSRPGLLGASRARLEADNRRKTSVHRLAFIAAAVNADEKSKSNLLNVQQTVETERRPGQNLLGLSTDRLFPEGGQMNALAKDLMQNRSAIIFGSNGNLSDKGSSPGASVGELTTQLDHWVTNCLAMLNSTQIIVQGHGILCIRKLFDRYGLSS